MAEPPAQVVEGALDVVRPARVGVLKCDPGLRFRQFISRGFERDTVGEIRAAIAKGKELGL